MPLLTVDQDVCWRRSAAAAEVSDTVKFQIVDHTTTARQAVATAAAVGLLLAGLPGEPPGDRRRERDGHRPDPGRPALGGPGAAGAWRRPSR